VHIILGLLGSIITILILFNRLESAGIDLGGLNPFAWHRRRQWKKRYQANPIFAMENAMEVTALLMVAVAKASGDMSEKQKAVILELFQQHFHLSERDAGALLTSSAFLLRDGEALRNNLKTIIGPAGSKFTPDQAESALSLIRKVLETESTPTALQTELHHNISTHLAPAPQPKGTWA